MLWRRRRARDAFWHGLFESTPSIESLPLTHPSSGTPWAPCKAEMRAFSTKRTQVHMTTSRISSVNICFSIRCWFQYFISIICKIVMSSDSEHVPVLGYWGYRGVSVRDGMPSWCWSYLQVFCFNSLGNRYDYFSSTLAQSSRTGSLLATTGSGSSTRWALTFPTCLSMSRVRCWFECSHAYNRMP